MTYSHDIPISDLFDELILSLNELIDRRFAMERTLIVERESEKHWVARIGDNVLYRSPDRSAVERFTLAFQQKTAGITVQFPDEAYRFSVRVPENVVPIRAEA